MCLNDEKYAVEDNESYCEKEDEFIAHILECQKSVALELHYDGHYDIVEGENHESESYFEGEELRSIFQLPLSGPL